MQKKLAEKAQKANNDRIKCDGPKVRYIIYNVFQMTLYAITLHLNCDANSNDSLSNMVLLAGGPVSCTLRRTQNVNLTK